MTQILNLKTTVEWPVGGVQTYASYEDEHGNRYAASYPAEVSASWMRRWIETCRQNDRNREAPA